MSPLSAPEFRQDTLALPSRWTLMEVAGRLVEISRSAASAALSVTFTLVRQAQERGEPVGWVTSTQSFFYPPDAARSGADLAALVVVRLADVKNIARAGEKLLRSGGFGVVVLDLGDSDIPMPLQTRLTGLAHRHHTALICVNEKARQQGVLPGLRYAAAFSLAAGLRVGEVSPAESKKAIAELTQWLMRFTPEVEPSSEELGIFWLNGAGLQHLYASPKRWAYAIHNDLRARGFTVNLAVGFTRFGSYGVAKSKRGITVFRDPAEEQQAARQVPLSRLNIEPEFRDALLQLGIKTIGDLLSLPSGGLRERFGKQAHRLYRMAAGDLWMPLEPHAPDEPALQKCI